MEKVSESKKVEFKYQGVGEANPRKQTLPHLKTDAKSEDILALSEAFQMLAPDNEPMEHLAIINVQNYSI